METVTATPRKGNGYASRKFILSLFVIGLSSALLYLGLVDAEVWKTIVGTCVLGYLAGNVGQEAVANWVGRKV